MPSHLLQARKLHKSRNHAGPARAAVAAVLAAGLAIIVLCFSQASKAIDRAFNQATGGEMERLQTIIDDVAGWDENEPGGESILRLRAGLALRASRADPRYNAWQHAAARRDGPLYVQYDPATKSIAALYMGVKRLVHSVGPSSDARTPITFDVAPSFYYINDRRAGAAEMIARLEDAAKRHQELFVISHPSTLEILAVRPTATK